MNRKAEAWIVFLAVIAGSNAIAILAIVQAIEGRWPLTIYGFFLLGVLHAALRRFGFFVVMDRRLFGRESSVKDSK